jgi:uncharacterized protein (DUF2384 family)
VIASAVVVKPDNVPLADAETLAVSAAELVTLTYATPFVNSFASLPEADLDPVLRFAIAIGLSEVRAKTAGIPSATYYRQMINDLLYGSLSTRIDEPK